MKRVGDESYVEERAAALPDTKRRRGEGGMERGAHLHQDFFFFFLSELRRPTSSSAGFGRPIPLYSWLEKKSLLPFFFFVLVSIAVLGGK